LITTVIELSDVVDALTDLLPEISARAEEFEQDRMLPADLVARLSASGAFRMLLPRNYGGAETTLPGVMGSLTRIARADASVAWSMMVAAESAIMCARFSAELLDREIFADGADLAVHGSAEPAGIAVPGEDGYLVSGRWPVSCLDLAHDWVVVNCVVMEDGAPRLTGAGLPEVRLALVPASSNVTVDVADSVGLHATCSSHLVIRECFVPARRTADFFGPSNLDATAFRLPIGSALALVHVAVVLGVTQGALDDLTTLAKTKRPAFNPIRPTAKDPVFLRRLGHLDLRLTAIQAMVWDQTERMCQRIAAGQETSPAEAVRLRAMVAYAHSECADIVDEAFSLAGSTATYNASGLQRRLRDVRTAAQHRVASDEVYQVLGALDIGGEVSSAALR
jgi:indole-3-acetate monooxygenase